MSLITVSIVWILLLIVFIGIPAIIGVFVWNDAKKRNMNAVAWTAISVLAPALVGFIAYLIISRGTPELKCPRCETAITDKYVICPICGAKLKPVCSNCSAPVEMHWKNCPICTNELNDIDGDVVSPKAPKDNVLRNVLIVIVLVPILFIATTLVVGNVYSSSTVGYSSSASAVLVDEFLANQNDELTLEWYKNIENAPNKAYILEYREDSEFFYAIYIPNSGAIDNFEINDVHDLFRGRMLNVCFFSGGSDDDEMIYLIRLDVEGDFDLAVYFNNDELEIARTPIDFDPLGNMLD